MEGLDKTFEKVQLMFDNETKIGSKFVQYIHVQMGVTHCSDCLQYEYRIFERDSVKPPVGIFIK